MGADVNGSIWRDKTMGRAVRRAAAIALLSVSAILSIIYVGDTLCLQAAEAKTITRYESAIESLEELDTRVVSADSLGEGDVEEADTLADFRRARDTAHRIADLRPSDTEVLPVLGSHSAVAQSVDANESLIAQIESARSGLEDALDAVEQSHGEHVTRIAREELEKSRTEAQAVYDRTDGRVSDDATREALKSAIDNAAHLIDGGTIDADALNAATGSINAAKEDVEQSNAEWEAARARAYANHGGVRYGGAGSTGSGNGTWNVSYRGTDDRSTANADGSVSEWKDGYYIAHDWSYGGGQIASKPGTVVVNGRTYRYVSSMVVSRDTTWSQVSGFVYANGGIGFQTCYGNGYLITHYEPV